MIVTIDGPAGAGKSTVARRLARELGLDYLNSGLIYRAVTLAVLELGGRFDDRVLVEDAIRDLDLGFGSGGAVFLGDREVSSRLTDPDVTSEVYRIANDGGYRRLLVDFQRQFGRGRGVVAEGRDMGSVIFPEADLKIYLDASPEERARRRFRELESRSGRNEGGPTVSYEDVLSSIAVRDEHDRSRKHAPLRVPDDAVVIDTDDLTVDEVTGKIFERMEERGLRRDSRPRGKKDGSIGR